MCLADDPQGNHTGGERIYPMWRRWIGLGPTVLRIISFP